MTSRFSQVAFVAILTLGLAGAASAQDSMSGYCCYNEGEVCSYTNDSDCAGAGYFFTPGDISVSCDEYCTGNYLCGNGEPDPGECGPQGSCLEDCGEFKTCDQYEEAGECSNAAGCFWYEDYSASFCEVELYYCEKPVGDSDSLSCDPEFGETEENCKDCRQICGNGDIEGDEECDDGNTQDGDDCNSVCKEEACGNGVVDYNEECDPDTGATYDVTEAAGATDECKTDCKFVVCGDGSTDKYTDTDTGEELGEDCDDGNDIEGDGCNNFCQFEYCGNGIIDVNIEASDGSKEECDDGNNDNGDGCSANCTIEFCGNGVVDQDRTPPEQCDDWNQEVTTYDDSGEPSGTTTDNGGYSATCNPDCTESLCGDGIENREAEEQCDNGWLLGGGSLDPTCDDDCKLIFCGDGITNPDIDEECDDGKNCEDGLSCGGDSDCPDGSACEPRGGDGCSEYCEIESCGNGIVDGMEECDPDTGATADPEVAMDNSPDCTYYCAYSFCGDDIVNEAADEECDPDLGGTDLPPFDADDSADCNYDCTVATCGDGYTNIEANEECDDGWSCTDGQKCTVSQTCDDGSECIRDVVDGCDIDCKIEPDKLGMCCYEYDYDLAEYKYGSEDGLTKQECIDSEGRFEMSFTDPPPTTEETDAICGYVGACCYYDGSAVTDAQPSTYDDCADTYKTAVESDENKDGTVSISEADKVCGLLDEYVCLDDGGGTKRREPGGETSSEDAYVADGVYVTKDQNDPLCDQVFYEGCIPAPFINARLYFENFYPLDDFCPKP